MVLLDSNLWIIIGVSIHFTIEASIPSGIIPALSRAKKKLDGCLVFKVDDGRDVFCTVDCTWIPQSLGESVFVVSHLSESAIGSVLPERFLVMR